AVISELEAIVGGNPHRERPVGQIMLALYRCDRQADALQAFRDLRGRLDELGLEPAQDLQELQLGILRQDDSLRAPEVEAPPPGPSEEPRSRRVVTVVAIDIAGADALDPETLDALLGRALGVTQSTAGRHGGRIERLDADGIVLVFGVPDLREDDALRAVRAAAE